MKLNLEPSDFEEMRYSVSGCLDFEPTDAQLKVVCDADPGLVALAVEWGWGDTEVREQLCADLERLTGLPSF